MSTNFLHLTYRGTARLAPDGDIYPTREEFDSIRSAESICLPNWMESIIPISGNNTYKNYSYLSELYSSQLSGLSSISMSCNILFVNFVKWPSNNGCDDVI